MHLCTTTSWGMGMTVTTQGISMRFTIPKPILAWRAGKLGKRMTKWTETCDAPQQRRKKGTFHNETELVSLASVVQFFGSYHKRKKTTKIHPLKIRFQKASIKWKRMLRNSEINNNFIQQEERAPLYQRQQMTWIPLDCTQPVTSPPASKMADF